MTRHGSLRQSFRSSCASARGSGEKEPYPRTLSEVQRYVGTYAVEGRERVEVWIEAGYLAITPGESG